MGFDDKVSAERAGKAVLKRMKSSGWKVRVWENMGWYYCLENGPVSLNLNDYSGKFFALISDDFRIAMGGLANWTLRGDSSYSDPNKAVKVAVDYLSKVMKRYNRVHELALKITQSGLHAKTKKGKK